MLSVETSEVSSVPGQRRVQRLKQEALLVVRRFPIEDAIPPEELRTDVGAEIGPLRPFRILRRLHRIRADVAERARHRHAIGLHEIALLVVRRVTVVALGVPGLARFLVEVRVREEPQTRRCRRLRRNTSRRAPSCRARQPARLCTCSSFSNGSAGHLGSRTSSHIP